MASDSVHEFTAANFESDVLGSDKPVLVDFWAEWCTPCKVLAPTIDAVADESGDTAKVGKLDIEGDGGREISVKYGINAIPTIIIFKGGEPAKRFVGPVGKDDLAAALAAAAV